MTVKKHLRAQEVALHNRLPCIYLVDSGGAFLPLQDEVFPDREHFGRIFFNQATMSQRGHPADRRRDGLLHRRRRLRARDERRDRDRPRAGHDLPRRPAAGEGGDRRGGHRRGARRRRPALAHLRRHRPPRRRRRARAGRSCAGSSPRSAPEPTAVGARRRSSRPRTTRTPLYGVVPADLRKPYDAREVIARIVDGSRFHEFKELYGTTLVCGFAHLHGHPVGILANNGILFSESALKGAHFIELCDQRRIPLRVPAEHHRLHGRPRLRGGRHRQARREARHRRVVRARAEADRDRRRLLRRRQLRHVRARVLAALPVHVAERAHHA